MDRFISLEDRFGAHNYHPLPVVITKGKGSWVWDRKGKKYLDLIGSYSAINYGHAHPQILKVLYKQAATLAMSYRTVYNDQLGPFLQELCKISGMQKALPMNSGAEAAETAIKAARRWGYLYKAIEENHAEIIVANENYHGRTTTLISLSTRPKYREGFGPFTPGFISIPFGSAEALEYAITPRTCAFIVEPMQGEAGVKIPSKGWLKKVAKICEKHHILLILDEIQTGLCRTGKTFAFQHEGIKPDGLILGKSLGGGVLPSSCFLASNELMDVFDPGSHGCTFGGNPLAAAVGLEALKIMQRDRYAARSKTLGDYFLKELKKIDSPYLMEIRGKGLWIGIDINPRKIPASHICESLLERGILAKETHEITIRLVPPIVITKKEIDWAIHRFKEVLQPGTPLSPLGKGRKRT